MKKRHSSGMRAASPLSFVIKVLFLVVVGATIGFFVFSFKNSKVGRFDRFNYVVTSSRVSLVSVDSKNQSAVVVNFPDSLYISNVAHGYGQYTINRIFDVGKIDNRGGIVLTDTIADYLGIPVDAYVRFSGNETGEVRNIFGALGFAFTTKESNLNFFDRLRLAFTLARLRFDKLRVIDIKDYSDNVLLADGSNGLSLDREKIDAVLKDEFLEESIRKEDLRIEVINSTEYLGLGAKVGRVISNIGGKVVSVGTESKLIDQCQIRASKELSKSITVFRIMTEYNCVIAPASQETQADIVIVVGSKYLNRLTK